MMKFAEVRQYTNPKIFFALLTVMIIAVGTTLAAVFAIAGLLRAKNETYQIRERQTLLDATYLSLREAESGQRGYLLTADEKYLEPFTNAVNVLPGELVSLKRVTRGHPEQTAIDRLLPSMGLKQWELVQSVALHRAGNATQALDLVASGEGQRLMSDINAQRKVLDTRYAGMLSIKSREAAARGNQALVIVVAAAVMTLLLSPLVYYLYVRAIASERELDHAKDEFVSLASHQLRTPATGIKSILSMVVAGDFGSLNEKQDRVLRRALESNEREIAIIEELLNVAKADAGRLVLRPSEVNLVELIDHIVSEQAPAIRDKNLILRFKRPHNDISLVGDEDKLYMAIGNLLDNARKYTPDEGSIEIILRGRRGQVEIEVSDSGVGIEEGDIARVFDRFHRGRGMLMGTVDGTGLGLYLARRIVELHNGSIEVDSRKGHGSRFTMTLPLRRT